MKNRKRRRVHHDRLLKLILWTALVFIPLLLLLWSLHVGDFIKKFRNSTEEPLQIEGSNRPTLNPPVIEEHRDRPSRPFVYPYSVVNGGVHSISQLQFAIWCDPVVAKHYSNFRLDRAKVIEAPSDGNFHVSYRIGQEIFWTKKKLRVAKGEKLITDGVYFTRTRCANRLSDVPPGKISPDEPTPETLDTPKQPLSDPPPLPPPGVVGVDPPATTPSPSDPPAFTPPVVTEGPSAIIPPPSDPPPFLPPGIGGDPPVPVYGNPGVGGNPPVPVPEPITLILLGSGLAGLWGFREKFKK